MRWRIRGIHAPSGAWRSAIVDASGKAEAEALGAAGGLTNIEASVERSKWFKLWALLYLVAMFGAGLLHAYYRGDRNSPRDLGAIVGAHVFGAAILLAVSALIKARGGKLLILIAVPAFVMGLSAGMKKPMPKSANARDVLADLSDMKETGARLPEVREGTKASGLEPFISLTGRMMERMAAQTADYEKKGSAENILDTLQSANLVDPARRAASRETIRRVDQLRVEHEKAVLGIMDDFLRETAALDIDPKRRADLLAGAKISHEKMVPVLRLQQALHGEYLNELSNILDLMDRADATLSDGRLTFATQREVDDYRRSLNRMNRLINVRQRRGQELQRNLPQMREHTQNQLGASLELQKLISWDPSPQSGARVKLDGRGIMIDGNLVMLAIEKSELIRLFGQPREVAGE